MFVSEEEKASLSQVLLPETSEPLPQQLARIKKKVPYILLSTPKSFVGMINAITDDTANDASTSKEHSKGTRAKEMKSQDYPVDLKRMSAVVVDEVDETLKGKSRYERKKVHEHRKPGEVLSRQLQAVHRLHHRNFQLIIASATVNYHARRLAAHIQGPERVITKMHRLFHQ